MVSKREKDQKAKRKASALNWANEQSQYESTSIKLPENCKFFKLAAGVFIVDFMPYKAGKGNKRADEGFEHFEREWQAHRVPGPDGKGRLYPCLYSEWEDNCPPCRMQNSADTNDDLAKELRPKTRHIWLLNEKPGKKPGTPENKWVIFDSNHYNKGMGFGEMMAEAIKAMPEMGETFADLKNGCQVKLTVKEQSGGGFKYNAVVRIDFLPRKYEYEDDVLEDAPCLDDMLIKPDPAELRKLLTGGDGDEDEAPRKKHHDEDDEDTPPKKGKVAEDDDDTDDDEEADKAPPKKGKQPVATDDDDDDDSDDDDSDNEDADDEPLAKGKKGGGKAEPTAEDLGIEKGSVVTYKGEECDVTRVSADGTSLTLENSEGDEYKAIAPASVKLVPTADAGGKELDDDDIEDDEEETPPKKGKGAKVADDDEDDDMDDDEEEDEDETPAPKGKSGKGKQPPPDDDDDEPLEDEEDEDDEPLPPKKGKGKR